MKANNQTQIREILLNEIKFRNMDTLHMYGFYFEDGKYHETMYVCSFSVLCSMLSNNGKAGSEIISLLKNKLNEPHQSPLTISLIDVFGYTQVFNAETVTVALSDNQCFIRCKG